MSDIAQDLGGVVLLPCPFCGGGGAFAAEMFNGDWRVTCGVCTAESSGEASEEEAITAWNTRTHCPEIAGALRDAERYRWLAANAIRIAFFPPDDEHEVVWETELGDIGHDLTLDTAIDSAMQHGGGGGEAAA